ncbi:MAG: FtsX-like permease family protein [Candidatus Marinimicrobia bacterium]|jgi:putative ABC transport system permease protein|nr:FtsX-like permease family protein [Candidatus Neomarinimicrobiota bacterium]MBT3946568.1 FtsX-like permease family protein [Candidatus Neomarinimicrobiota bacterium]MBT4064334.1 FtsX-like permease family protein [Candidatus Neomarinimicrobiota bacterium]MBT4308141.1 FtsX-like permease family protein [Candidatus Neomarinimicrobiota bacterium]MBT4453751.1 FtsX-like permease family protein [Candidatus Neomarinimicrobiota bacterium]
MAKQSHLKNTIKESFRMAIESIRQNKLRSILTLLGISIGVFSVIGVMTAIRTLESSVNSQLDIFGTNTFMVQKAPAIQIHGPGNNKIRKRKNILYTHYEELKQRAKLPRQVSVVDGTGERNIQYKDKRLKKTAELSGVDEWGLRSFKTYLADGRNFMEDDIRFYRSVTILGPDLADILFPFEDPIGKVIQIKGLDYTVIGITERKGQAFGQSQDYFVMIPISVYIQRFSNRWTSLGINVEAESTELYEKTMDEVIGLMRVIRKVPPKEENDFEIISNEELMDTFAGFTGGIKLFAGAVSVIALLVAGIGIMNIMLVSVTDRIKEIGVRKAIGATKRDILTQFLMEAIFLSQFGGIVGVILGIAGGNLIALLLKVPAVIPMDWAFYGMAVCSFIGIGFGIYPAYRAANLDPIESLRFE